MFLDGQFKQIELTPAAQQYLAERLKNGRTLSRLIAKVHDIAAGALFVSMPPESLNPPPDLRHGGEGEADLKGSQTRLEHAVERFVSTYGQAVVFEHQLAKQGDAWLNNKDHIAKLAYFNGEVYQFLQPHERILSIVPDFVHEVTACPRCLGYFCRNVPSDIEQELTDAAVHALAENVQAAVLCAFDDAGYLVWCPQHAGT